MSKTLSLLTRTDCPLCDEMAAAVRARIAGAGHVLALVDVDADPGLREKYGWEVPLLFDGDTELCRHRLNLPALQEWLAAQP